MSASTAIHNDAIPAMVRTQNTANLSAIAMFCERTCDVCCETSLVLDYSGLPRPPLHGAPGSGVWGPCSYVEMNSPIRESSGVSTSS